jgi:hypothetical protein
MLIRLRLCEESKTILLVAHMIAPLISFIAYAHRCRYRGVHCSVIILTNRAKLSILNWRVNTQSALFLLIQHQSHRHQCQGMSTISIAYNIYRAQGPLIQKQSMRGYLIGRGVVQGYRYRYRVRYSYVEESGNCASSGWGSAIERERIKVRVPAMGKEGKGYEEIPQDWYRSKKMHRHHVGECNVHRERAAGRSHIWKWIKLLARRARVEVELRLTIRLDETPSTQVVRACAINQSVSHSAEQNTPPPVRLEWGRTPCLPEPRNTTMSSNIPHIRTMLVQHVDISLGGGRGCINFL